MLISNNPVFTDLIASNPPSLVWTTHDPNVEWSRPELLALAAGSLVVRGTTDPACSGLCAWACLYVKKRQTSTVACVGADGAKDYVKIGCQEAVGGALPPDGTDPELCSLPVGSLYLQLDGSLHTIQIWAKILNDCGSADWRPITMLLTRTGTTVTWNTDTQVLNLPVGGNLTLSGGIATWTPDDGTAGFSFDVEPDTCAELQALPLYGSTFANSKVGRYVHLDNAGNCTRKDVRLQSLAATFLQVSPEITLTPTAVYIPIPGISATTINIANPTSTLEFYDFKLNVDAAGTPALANQVAVSFSFEINGIPSSLTDGGARYSDFNLTGKHPFFGAGDYLPGTYSVVPTYKMAVSGTPPTVKLAQYTLYWMHTF